MLCLKGQGPPSRIGFCLLGCDRCYPKYCPNLGRKLEDGRFQFGRQPPSREADLFHRLLGMGRPVPASSSGVVEEGGGWTLSTDQKPSGLVAQLDGLVRQEPETGGQSRLAPPQIAVCCRRMIAQAKQAAVGFVQHDPYFALARPVVRQPPRAHLDDRPAYFAPRLQLLGSLVHPAQTPAVKQSLKHEPTFHSP